MEFLKNFLLIGFTTVGIIGSIFGLIIYLSNKKHIKEIDKNPILTLRTGGHFGGLNNFSFPFVRTTLYEKFIVISYWKKIVIPYDQIITLKKSEFLGNGFDIITKNKNKYGTPSIWTFNKSLSKKIMDQVKKRAITHR